MENLSYAFHGAVALFFKRSSERLAMHVHSGELAESKGLYGWRLIARHALRNTLIPIITVLAPLIVDLMTGSLVVEKIFAIPGVGSLLVTAIQSNDYNVVIALSFIYSALYIGIMLAVDILSLHQGNNHCLSIREAYPMMP